MSTAKTPMLEPEPRKSFAQGPLLMGALLEALMALQSALEHFDASAGELIESLIEQYGRGVYREYLRQIAEDIACFEQEAALEKVRSLRLKLGSLKNLD